jgi:hypothetical protein
MIAGTNFLRFWANPQKYQTLVPAKNSRLKVCVQVVLHFVCMLVMYRRAMLATLYHLHLLLYTCGAAVVWPELRKGPTSSEIFTFVKGIE